MKTVFMIAPYFIPRRRVGSLRPFKFAVHLHKFGWKPVICTIKELDSQKTEAEKKALEGIEIFNLEPPFDRTANHSENPRGRNKEGIIHKVGEGLADWLDRQIPMDAWYFLFRSSYGKLLAKAKEVNPDLIWSTGDPWSGHWVGHKLSHDLRTPWMADFRDPWTLTDLNLRGRSWFSSAMDRKLEKKFVSSADKVIFTSKSAEQNYREHYALSNDKTATIYNSFHPTEIGNVSEPSWSSEPGKDYLNIIFFGSFRRLSPVLPIAKSLSLMDPDVRKNIRVHSFGSMDQQNKNAIHSLGLADNFITHKKVKPEQAPAVFEKADLLLVSTSQKRKTIIPAKLWEYLPSGKPILSITPNPEVGEILTNSGSGVHFPNEKEDEIADWLATVVHKFRKGEAILDGADKRSEIGQYSSRSTTKQLAEIMDELTSHE